MENEQLDTALEELESRLERLRALYEQYFLGIEKLEPAIPRKDVDRRIYVLRREKIRNTGKRFKLQTLISRYNTFQQYWQRICREIENGTYKRHLLRAEKNIGPTNLLTTAARRRFGRNALLRDSQQPAAPQAAAPAQPEAAAAAQPAPMAAATANPASEPAPPVRPRSRTPTWPGLPTPPPPSGAAPPPPFNAQVISPVRVPAGVQPTVEAQRFAAAASTSSSVPAARPAPSSSPRRSAPFESLELDMDFMGDWDPSKAAKGRSAIGASTNAQPPAARRGPQPAAPRTPPRQTLHEEEERTPVREQPRPAVAPAPVAPVAAGRVAASSVPPAQARRLAPPPKPKRDPAFAAPPSAAPSAPPPERRPTVQRPLTERPPAPKPASAPPAIATTTAAGAAAARAKAARPRTAPAEGNVSDGKLRELHQRLAEASKSTGQPTVSFDGLSKSLKAAEAKLREKHGNRRIDFEVVLKDGKPVVKPVVR